MIGETISHYKIVEKLGEGGMGVVYKATDLSLKRTVAIKVPRTELIEDEESKKRLLREARAAASLGHPNICIIHEVGKAEGLLFIVMEYIQGESLVEIISRERMEMSKILDIGIQIAEGLNAAHEKDLIHRDIKSSNILVTEQGVAKITDFGLAKHTKITAKETTVDLLTKDGQLIGTPGYISPEQARAEGVDHRSDIFSCGVVLYEMVTGRLPFGRDNIISTVDALLHKEADPMARYRSQVPEGLEKVVNKMLAKDRERRYQTVKEVAIDLRSLKKEIEREEETKVPVQEIITTKKAYRIKLGLVVGLMVIAATVLGIWLYYFPRPVLPFAQRDWILLADFENQTGEGVFDRTLKEALTVSLEQSPYCNVYPRERIKESLRRMKKETEKIDESVGREICQREGIRALLFGSIDSVDGNYLLTAKIVDPSTGKVVKPIMVRAKGKSEVLDRVDELAKQIRGSLGEALNSIAKSNKKLEEVTTSSLEALKFYSLGLEQQHLRGNFSEAIPFYKTAIEIDPNFAAAYKSLASANIPLRNINDARKYARQAFELKDKVTDREKLHIQALYDMLFDRYQSAIDSYKLLVKLYPDDLAAQGNLSYLHDVLGQFDQSLQHYQETLRISPNSTLTYANLASVTLCLGRYDDSLQYTAKILEINPQDANALFNLISANLGKGELQKAREQCKKMILSENTMVKFSGKERLAVTYIYEGKLAAANDELLGIIMLSEKYSPLFEAHDRRLKATLYELLGDRQKVIEELDKVVKLSDKGEGYLNLLNLALTGKLYARSGYLDKAKQTLDKLEEKLENEQSDQSSALRALVRGEIELVAGNFAEAVNLFQRAALYSTRYSYLQAHDSLAHCYFSMKDYDQSIEGYETLINQKGWTLDYWAGLPHSWIVAHYWLGRAYEEKGLTQRAVENYEKLVIIWKNADRNFPRLEDAKRRLSRLKP